MRIAKVIGTVTLSRVHPALSGGRLKMVVPQSLADLANGKGDEADPLVAWDDLGAGIGSMIALSEGGEAAAAFYPAEKPVDAYSAALLDNIDINKSQVRKLKT
jgi:ethanolamine utilization protein EutN